MKKFLTVLLALSVVFTYSFSAAGSVFAATDSTPNYTAARDALLSELEASYNSANKVLEDADDVYDVGNGSYNIKLDARALKEVSAKVYNDYKEVIQKQYEVFKVGTDATSVTNAKTAFTDGTNKVEIDYLDLTDAYYGQVAGYDAFLKVVTGKDTAGLYLETLFDTLLQYNKAYVLAELDNVDLGAYSDAVMDKTDAFETTYAEKATQVVSDAKKAVEKISFDENDTVVTKAAALERLAFVPNEITEFNADGDVSATTDKSDWAYIEVGTENVSLIPSKGYETIDGDKVTTKYILKGVANLATSEALKGDEAEETATRAAYKAYVEKKYAETYASYLADKTLSKAELAANVENLDKYRTVALAIIEEGTLAQAEGWADETNFAAQLAAAPGRYDDYADAEKRAAIFKLATDKTGELLYDAEVIDKNMEALKIDVYYNKRDAVADSEILAGAPISADSFAWDKEVALAKTEKARKDALGAEDKYYAPEKEAINALFDKKVAEINACTTSKQIAKVMETKVTVPATVKDAETIIGEFEAALGGSGLSSQLETANKYIEVKNAGKYSNDPTRISISNENLKTLMAETFAENGARTNTAAKGMMDKVYAAIDAYPTLGAQEANVKAVQEAIDALPATITNAEKETVRAAFDAFEALTPDEKAEVDMTRLNKAIAALKKLAEDEINAAIKALPKTLTAADKAAVEEAQALIDAYDEETLWAEEWAENELKDEFEAVRKAEAKDVMEAIYKLGTNPSAEAVKAARAAYDAYVAYWTSAEDGDDAADDILNDDTLFYAEAQIKVATIKAVESLKIKASSSAVKGKITVKWNVTGDVPAGTVYKVYKSTKAQSGYAYMGKTTKNYMANKKNLKKGKRYFYKVKAVLVVDGVTYTSDWSNKANRFAK